MLLKKLLENVHEGGGQGFALTKISSSIPGGEDSVANRSMVGLGVFASTAAIDEVYVMFNVLT
jgi:hypothetical protein